jgi:hypothetical protein
MRAFLELNEKSDISLYYLLFLLIFSKKVFGIDFFPKLEDTTENILA